MKIKQDPEGLISDLGLLQLYSKQELIGEHSSPLPRNTATKSMVKMSSKDGRKVAIILWSDEHVTVIATDIKGNSHISTADSPDVYYIAQKQYIDQGLELEYAEEDGKEIGMR